MPERDEVYDKASVYEDDDGQVVYRASALGSCDGALVRARLGVTGSPPTDTMQTRFDEGHEYEAEVIARGLGVDFIPVTSRDHLALHGKPVEHADGWQVETEIAWGKAKDGTGGKVVRCHPDGIAIRGSTGKKVVVEAKFFGEDLFDAAVKDFDAFMDGHPRYKWQAAVEMLSTGLPLLYVIGRKDVVEVGGERVVRGVGEVLVTEITELPYTLKDVKARVLEVEGYVARGEMPACPVPFDFPCAFWDHHEKVGKQECDDPVLTEWVQVWRLAAKAKDQADKDVEFAKGAIAEQMVELKLDSAVCDGVEVVWVRPQEKGNVSWSRAYKALSQQTGERVDEDEFRGKATGGYVRVSEAAKDGE